MNDELTLKLPCPLGGTLWRVCATPTRAKSRANVYVKPVTFSRNNFWPIVVEQGFGRLWFLTEEEAMEAAEKMKEEMV